MAERFLSFIKIFSQIEEEKIKGDRANSYSTIMDYKAKFQSTKLNELHTSEGLRTEKAFHMLN